MWVLVDKWYGTSTSVILREPDELSIQYLNIFVVDLCVLPALLAPWPSFCGRPWYRKLNPLFNQYEPDITTSIYVLFQ